MAEKEIDIRDFAKRVEALCEFILEHVPKDGTPDVRAIQQLQIDAADVQLMNTSIGGISLVGLDDHIRGFFTSKV